ncbi:MAG: tRNA (mo5U34)-methyltransferase [Candidatus Azotimanducaceae bacterium]
MPIHQFIDECFANTDSLAPFHSHLQQQIDEFFSARPHGRSDEWNDALGKLPTHNSLNFNLDANTIKIGNGDALSPELPEILKTFKPWRKGPFQIGDQVIDTEWRSDWKWQRIQPHITSLAGRSVLDIGCGNGYHLLRMLGDGANMALGIDPTRLFLYQFHILRHFLPDVPAWLLPLRSEHLPAFGCFDTVFSLGVLYHRRSPLDHLTELRSFLAPGGELVLETLIIEGDAQAVLTPEDRYAKMANVWFLPSPAALENWLRRTGFVNVRTVDVNQTSKEEQRATEWMDFHSLAEFLDPNDPNLTAEGLPAPKRAIVIANKP